MGIGGLLVFALACGPSGAAEATADGQALAPALAQAVTQLQSGTNPWAQAGAGPQAAQARALRLSLAGNDLWEAFKPVDCALRAAYRDQHRMYVDKDAGLLNRRNAWYCLDTLEGALSGETIGNYAHARWQLAQVRHAISRRQFQAALCALWHFAAATGLWDRQVALEAVEKHLALLQRQYEGRSSLSPGQQSAALKTVTCLRDMVQVAVLWTPPVEEPVPAVAAAGEATPAETVTPEGEPACLMRPVPLPEWDELNTQVPVGSYRKYVSELNPPLYKERHPFIKWSQQPCPPLIYAPLCSHCSNPDGPDKGRHAVPGCLLTLRPWQTTLGETGTGWAQNTRCGGWQEPGCDWQQYHPVGSWPGAKGADNAGGL